MKLLVSIFLACLLSNSTLAQSYLYKYIDPCTGNMKSITIPSNGNVTVSYYGSVKTFATSEMTDGTFESWANDVYSTAGSVNPCSEVVGLGTAVNVNQSQALGILNILNSLSTAMDYMGSGATNMLGGSLASVDNAGSNQKKKTNSSNGNTNTSSAGNTNVTEGNQGSNSQSTAVPNSESSTTNNNNSSQTNTQSNDNVGNNASNGSGSSNTNSNTNSNSSANSNGGTSGNQSTNSQTGGSNAGTNTAGSKGNSGSIEGQGNSNNQSNNQSNDGNGNNTGNGSSPGNSSDNTSSNSNGNTTGGGTTNGGGNSGTQTTAGKSESDVTKTETPGGTEKTEPTGGKTDITSGSSNSVKEVMSKNGKPTIIASGDFIGFNFKNQDAAYGSKVTGGYTAVKWNGLRTSGLLFDYTSAIKGPNITGFTAWIKPKAVTLVSTTATFGFEGFGSQYGTLAVGQIRKFKKIKKLKLAYVATFTFGQVYKIKFIGTAAIVGAMYDIKLHKRLDIKLTNLFIYAPYVSYQNDIVMKSPYVMLPSVGFNIGITKRFKFNINAGGAWAIKDKAMNYTVICGTRFIL